MLLLLAATASALAGSATWKLNPGSGDWDTPSNWTPASVPKEPGDTATFDISNQTAVLIGNDDIFDINGIVFSSGASPFTITVASFFSFPLPLTISGTGITNNSRILQNFVTEYSLENPDGAGEIFFTNAATAGKQTLFTNDGGVTTFFDTSSAERSTFNNLGAGSDSLHVFAGETDFIDSSTADSAKVIANGSTINGGAGGVTTFQDTSTAGNARLIAEAGTGGGEGGTISFSNDSTGGTARVEVFGNGSLDISAHNAPGVTVGSIDGTGKVSLGANNLTAGSNPTSSTAFSGVIQDGGIGGGTGGSVTKVGKGELVLSNANAYTGGTTISGGNLIVANHKGSATGTGTVQVDAGAIGGAGIITGPVVIGAGSGTGAFLSPGKKGIELGSLTLLNTLTFNSDATYLFEFDTDNITSDHVIADAVTIRGHAEFSAANIGTFLLSSAELYDPAVGTWSATGSLITALSDHTATLLPSGQVLVAGSGTSAELYDPATGTWLQTGSLAHGRLNPSATLLISGKVLVAGGGYYPDTSCELYDPATGMWSDTGSLNVFRSSHTATLLPSGSVLVAGGNPYDETASAELYDPATGTWSVTGSLATARAHHTATLLPSGKVLVAGGLSNFLDLTSAELYNPAMGTWSATGNLATGRERHSATLLPGGDVLVAGGFGGNASAELYHPDSGTWSNTGSLNTARGGHTATLLPDNKVLAAAGFSIDNYPYPPLSSAELYDPASGTWSDTNSLAAARKEYTATLLPDGKVLVAGGVGNGTLPVGTVFTVIDNMAATPISGRFANLKDGGIFTVGNNTFQADYEGGDGNDLTLTVVMP